jgi:hypothetical protein
LRSIRGGMNFVYTAPSSIVFVATTDIIFPNLHFKQKL